ncbi:PAS domain S-box protein [Marinobacterium sp. AK62]|uniref:histidine kinase n=1 Tax=Marinobacterium alkalitolerans TaxID=1542925 RepID=A0ABS3Z937_9GAMM|nr:PAS domain S-box protein [Marinobacterium alkalitolerans]MBP0047519.1 PAS domain S-box protein [Marinobacterium alkalitolerans]
MSRLWALLVFGILTGCMLLLSTHWMVSSEIRQEMLLHAQRQHALVQDTIRRFKSSQESLIGALTQHSAVKNFASAEDDANELLLHTTHAHQSIMQLRVLDTDGHERYRVDRSLTGTVKLVPQEELQSKSHRYYTRSFMTLEKGEIGYSQFDLNMEHGKLEQPFNPTLRIGTPIIREDRVVGYLVINYYMEGWDDYFGSFADTDVFIVDQDDHFLHHPEGEWAWSGYSEPPRTAGQYFKGLNAGDVLQGRDAVSWIDDSTIALPLDLFGQSVLALYRQRTPVDSLVFEKLYQFGGISLVALLLVMVPAGRLIYVGFRQVQEERDKEQEQAYFIQQVFENTFDGLVVLSPQGTIVRANRAVSEVFGYSCEELLRQNINELVALPHRMQRDAGLNGFLAHSRSLAGEDREVEGFHADGSTLPVSIAFTQVSIGRAPHFIGTIRDLSLIRSLEQEARQKESMMTHQAKLAALGEMLVAIAHQWRQPLHGIGLIVQDVVLAHEKDRLTPDYLHEAQDEVMGQLEYLSDTIDEFRRFFGDEGRVQSCNLAGVVAQIQRLFSPQLKAHSLGLAYRLASDAACSKEVELTDLVRLDELTITNRPAEIKQLLLNLIANAREAIEQLERPAASQQVITIEFSASGSHVFISVMDRAGGVDTDLASRMFEPYVTSKRNGTGLGLFIARALAERRLNGELSYTRLKADESQPHSGSCFTLSLPRLLETPFEGGTS